VTIFQVSYADDPSNGPGYDKDCSNRGKVGPGEYPYHRWQLRVKRENGLAFVDQWEPINKRSGGNSYKWARNLLGPDAVGEDGSFDETLLEGMECQMHIVDPKPDSNFNGRVTSITAL
jgi:hypothetical protein